MKDKIAKLPKWAQEHIRILERDNAYLKSKIDELIQINNNEHPETNIYYTLFTDLSFKKYYLPLYPQVTFIGNKTKVSVIVDPDNQIRIDIGNGLIMPQARNSICIIPEGD